MSEKNLARQNFDKIVEPSLESADPEERKFARQLRIQKRAEAFQKYDGIGTSKVIDESPTEKQIRYSTQVLDKLIDEGYEVISNVRVANDARQIERESEADKIYEKLLKDMKETENRCKEEYDVITKRWLVILKMDDPLELEKAVKEQVMNCERLMKMKDTIIEQIQDEIERADNVYFDDQRTQKDDVKLLFERIEKQMNTVEHAYTKELQLIEKALKMEREALVSSCEEEWELFYKQEMDEDREADERLAEIISDHEAQMETLMENHDEKLRAQKITLDKECHILQQKLEQTKALCLLNYEKLSYNYIVLKTREEENTILKGQQKRKINKLQSTIQKLKQEYSDLEFNTKAEIDRLSKQILKAHKNIIDIEAKSNHFTTVNDKRYLDIWDMNTQNANELVEKILAADQIIHERTLGVLWQAPQKNFPEKEDLPSYRAAISVIQKRKQEEAETYKMFQYEPTDPCSPEMKLESQLLNNILKQISNCSNYLIEDKLSDLISNLPEAEKTIVQLDNIFQALSISTPEQINMLINFFLPYAYCKVCAEKPDTISSISSSSGTCECYVSEKDRLLIDTVKEEIETKLDCSGEDRDKTLCPSIDSFESDYIFNEDFDNKNEIVTSKFTCEKGHVLEIQTVDVTKILKNIVDKFNDVEQKNKFTFEEKLQGRNYTVSRNITEEDIKNYWSKYQTIFDDEKEILWDTILVGLNNYYEVLQERQELCNEIERLTKQNCDLKQLLQSQDKCAKEDLTKLNKKPIHSTAYKLKTKT